MAGTLSPVMPRAYNSLAFGVYMGAPVARAWPNVMGVLWVDDMELVVMDKIFHVEDLVWNEPQRALSMGGAIFC